jgi:hypothetical protein
MSALDHSHLLTRLIILCELLMQQRYNDDAASALDLHEKIDAEFNRPADGERVITDAVVMCMEAALLAQHAMMQRQRLRSFTFVRVIGVLLPDVRDALALALEQRMRPTP